MSEQVWTIIYLIIGYAVGVISFWPYRKHPIISGWFFWAWSGMVAIIWPFWLIQLLFAWIADQFDRRDY